MIVICGNCGYNHKAGTHCWGVCEGSFCKCGEWKYYAVGKLECRNPRCSESDPGHNYAVHRIIKKTIDNVEKISYNVYIKKEVTDVSDLYYHY